MNSNVTKKLIHINMIIQKSKLENQINLNDTRQGLNKYQMQKIYVQQTKNTEKAKSESSSIAEKYTETNTIKPK